MAKFFTDVYVNLLNVINIYIICVLIYTTLKSQLSLARLCKLVGYAVARWNLKITEEMKSWFMKREDPVDLTSSEMRIIKSSNSRLKRNYKNQNMKGILLVVTYHHLLKSLGAIIGKILNVLYMNKDVKKVFTLGPMISFLSAHKSNSYLVRAKLYPLERTIGTYKCKSKRCQVCDNITEADSITCSNDQTLRQIIGLTAVKDAWYIWLHVIDVSSTT